jgi:chitinase
MKDLRKVLGDDKLLTLASVASGEYIDFKAVSQVVDFVNIMSYDMEALQNIMHLSINQNILVG